MQPVSGWQGIRNGVHARPVPDHRDVGRPTACCTTGRSRASAARATRSITRAPRPPASTDPTSSAAASSAWSAATRPATAWSTASFPGDTADLSNAANYRTIDYAEVAHHLRPQHDGRPRRWQRAAEGTCRRIPTMRSCMASRRTRSTPTSSIRARQRPRPTASGTTAGRATPSAAATACPATPARPSPGLPGRLQLRDRPVHPLDLVSPARRAWPVQSVATHFQGISSPVQGIYTLSAERERCHVEHAPSGRPGDGPPQPRRLLRPRVLWVT